MTSFLTKNTMLVLALAAATSLAAIDLAAAQSAGGNGGGGNGGGAGASGGSHGGSGGISRPQPIGVNGPAGAPGTPPTHVPRRPDRRPASAPEPNRNWECGVQKVGRGTGAIYLRFCGNRFD